MLTESALPHANAYAMICRRALAAGIATKIGNHMANHASTRTTKLYDRGTTK